MEFFYYDLIFLAVFCFVAAIFLIKKRKNVKKESKVFFLYRTRIGLKIIDRIGRRWRKGRGILSFFSIIIGFTCMIGCIALLVQTAKIMTLIRIPIPPIMPLIPYLPRIFKITFLPPFYFTYWIIAIAIVSIVHEFSHGIFARMYRVKVKATGFAFLGPFLAAFVEPDEKKLSKKTKKAQIATFCAGPFANIIATIFFILLMQLFFISAFSPTGVIFNIAGKIVNVSDITIVGNMTFQGLSLSELETFVNKTELPTEFQVMVDNQTVNFTKIVANNRTYVMPKNLQQQIKYEKKNTISIFYDSPALRLGMVEPIRKINGIDIKDRTALEKELEKYKPDDSIFIECIGKNYTIILAKNPENKSKAFLGIGFLEQTKYRWIAFLSMSISQQRNPFTYYEPKRNANLTIFIYNLFFWLILINFSIALINMLPLGIFDGGRTFYLTALAITKKKRKALAAFKIASYIILLLFLLLMFIWLANL